MDREAVLRAYDAEMRENARPDGPGARIERVGRVVRQIGPDFGWTGVLWSDLDEACADAEIAAQVRHFAGLGREFEWKVYSHDRPADLPERLRAAGFTAGPPETLMIGRIADLPTGTEPPAGILLRPVTDAAGVDLAMEANRRAFGTDNPDLGRQLLSWLAETPETVVAVVAVTAEDGRPVSSARMELTPGTRFAGLWGGGTVPEWRGRGIYRALVAYRARIAAARGYEYLQVDASADSRPILERLGFAARAVTTPYVRGPEGAPPA
ncbi:GNAT family N-acetyltransferase [Kitasatospora camelliae]|uniref:GNAT family N-acetyltransferase n=1 Tax=Kitasatospora camelliae TaxID=3156397 RepID=A0AAU8K283_9ACTN